MSTPLHNPAKGWKSDQRVMTQIASIASCQRFTNHRVNPRHCEVASYQTPKVARTCAEKSRMS